MHVKGFAVDEPVRTSMSARGCQELNSVDEERDRRVQTEKEGGEQRAGDEDFAETEELLVGCSRAASAIGETRVGSRHSSR